MNCVLQQDTLSSVLVHSRKIGKRPNMTEKLLTGRLKASKSHVQCYFYTMFVCLV